jgi:hypothetical protein
MLKSNRRLPLALDFHISVESDVFQLQEMLSWCLAGFAGLCCVVLQCVFVGREYESLMRGV